MLVHTLSKTGSSFAVQISAPAKVNLFLEILGKRTDGFHELATVMTSVSLFDQIQFSPNDSGKIQLTISFPDSKRPAADIPVDEGNLIVASLLALRDTCGSPDLGMDVVLEKRIPAAAGLGGASSNAAAAIVAGDLAWRLGMRLGDRSAVAAQIGSDVPFFLYGGTALCTGRGEKIRTVAAPDGIALVIAKPICGLSTPAVFQKCVVPGSPVNVDEFLEAVTHGNPRKIADSMHNRLQPVAESLEQEVLALAKAFDQTGCLGHQMSGSGTSYFGIFSDVRAAGIAADELGKRNPDWEVFNVQSLGQNDVIAA